MHTVWWVNLDLAQTSELEEAACVCITQNDPRVELDSFSSPTAPRLAQIRQTKRCYASPAPQETECLIVFSASAPGSP